MVIKMTDIRLLKTTEKRYQILESMNINSLEDIVMHYPYRYDIIEETYPTLEDDKIIIEQQLFHQPKFSLKEECQECLLQLKIIIFNNIRSQSLIVIFYDNI